MTVTELNLAVKKIRPPFLDGLAQDVILTILSAGRQRRFLARSIITNQGHPADQIFMLLTGGARSFFLTHNGQKLHMFSYPPGEMFGGMALVPRRSEYIVSTEAVKDSQTLIWDRDTIRSLATQHPKLLDNALTIASDYLNMMIATQVSLSFHTARQRLAEVLMRFASGVGRRVTNGIELPIHNEELAAAANLTPFTVSRFMSEWQRSGLVKKRRGVVLLTYPEKLLLQDL